MAVQVGCCITIHLCFHKNVISEQINISNDLHHWSVLCFSFIFFHFNQVGDKNTVGPEAFARIAPACPLVADIITVHNLFDALTSSSGGQLHFLIYDKYLGSLNKYDSSC